MGAHPFVCRRDAPGFFVCRRTGSGLGGPGDWSDMGVCALGCAINQTPYGNAATWQLESCLLYALKFAQMSCGKT